MNGEDLYNKAIALGALPVDATDWWGLRYPDRVAWEELAAQAKNEWFCRECGTEIDSDEVPELVKETA